MNYTRLKEASICIAKAQVHGEIEGEQYKNLAFEVLRVAFGEISADSPSTPRGNFQSVSPTAAALSASQTNGGGYQMMSTPKAMS